MQRILQSVLALTLICTAGGVAEAGKRSSGSSDSRPTTVPGNKSHSQRAHPRKVRKPERIRKRARRDYHRSHGKRFRHGYFYAGRHHRHWTHRWYSHRYRSYFFWCPSLRCYYYWSAARTAFYPVRYIYLNPPAGITDADLVMDGIPEDETEIPPVPDDE